MHHKVTSEVDVWQYVRIINCFFFRSLTEQSCTSIMASLVCAVLSDQCAQAYSPASLLIVHAECFLTIFQCVLIGALFSVWLAKEPFVSSCTEQCFKILCVLIICFKMTSALAMATFVFSLLIRTENILLSYSYEK